MMEDRGHGHNHVNSIGPTAMGCNGQLDPRLYRPPERSLEKALARKGKTTKWLLNSLFISSTKISIVIPDYEPCNDER